MSTTEPNIDRVIDAPSDNFVYRILPRWLWPHAQLARWDRPIGWQLLMWPCFWSSALAANALAAEGRLNLGLFVFHLFLFFAGSVAMRGAGCTYNDLVDHEIDNLVARTRSRPLPSGRISRRNAKIFMVVQSLVGLAVLLCFNSFSIMLGILSLAVVAIYPFAKRFTDWPQFFLGLAFSWGGSTYPWGSPEILGLFALAALGLFLWVWAELRVEHPLFDLSVFRIPTFTYAALASFFYGPAFLGTVAFLPLYLQVVKGVSASQSGVTVLPLTLGVVLGSVGAGQAAARLGRYKALLLGSALFLLALFLAFHFVLQVDTPLWLAVGLFFLSGLGLGPAQSLLNVAAQNDVPMARIGSATSAVQFMRQIGSTMGIALLGTVLAGSLTSHLAQAFPGGASAPAMARSGEGMALDLDREFARLEDLLVRALKGDEAAYRALVEDPALPKAFLKDLIPGGLPARFARLEGLAVRALQGDEAAYRALLADPGVPQALKARIPPGGLRKGTLALLERALSGDPGAKAALLASPFLDARLKALVESPPPPALRDQLLRQVDAALARAEPEAERALLRALAQAEAKALDEVPRRAVEGLERTKARLKGALSLGITEALRRIFLFSALFIALALAFILLLPDRELKGRPAPGGVE